ncbi:pseudouridine synthase [Atopococcus tabaci]|uniref:pseudouridine synthase n=1 Tax=Atopococcus tabaci TaxID=269774 RepID=UPI000410527F|nr:pseudouridine synthase [Atopococcus tabaci]
MERLQKVMAHAGVASRRKSEQLIAEGRVTVNGEIVTDMGTKVSRQDTIAVDGIVVEREHPVYFLLNKPRGVISSVSDEKGRKTVVDLLPEIPQRIYPIGRLDYDTTGALILTNDGEFANLLMHPRFEIDKTYVAKVKGILNKQTLRQLEKGVVIDGKRTAPAKGRILSQDYKKETTMVELTIHEGRNQQVKKMFEAVKHPVMKLKRETYGSLTLGGLQSGEWRELKPFEVNELIRLAKSSQK